MGSASFILGASQWPQRCVADGLETPSHLPAWLMIQMATVIVGFDCTDDHSQILQPTWKSVGRPIPSRGDNFLQRPLALQHHTIRYSVHNSAVSEVVRCWWLCCIRCWGCGVMNTIENHLLHLNRGPGANGDSRRWYPGVNGDWIPRLALGGFPRIMQGFYGNFMRKSHREVVRVGGCDPR